MLNVLSLNLVCGFSLNLYFSCLQFLVLQEHSTQQMTMTAKDVQNTPTKQIHNRPVASHVLLELTLQRKDLHSAIVS